MICSKQTSNLAVDRQCREQCRVLCCKRLPAIDSQSGRPFCTQPARLETCANTPAAELRPQHQAVCSICVSQLLRATTGYLKILQQSQEVDRGAGGAHRESACLLAVGQSESTSLPVPIIAATVYRTPSPGAGHSKGHGLLVPPCRHAGRLLLYGPLQSLALGWPLASCRQFECGWPFKNFRRERSD